MLILKHMLTGIDNTTWDIGRLIGAASAGVGLGLQVLDVVRGRPFDMQAFGLGCGALAVGVGAMLKLKAGTEPEGVRHD